MDVEYKEVMKSIQHSLTIIALSNSSGTCPNPCTHVSCICPHACKYRHGCVHSCGPSLVRHHQASELCLDEGMSRASPASVSASTMLWDGGCSQVKDKQTCIFFNTVMRCTCLACTVHQQELFAVETWSSTRLLSLPSLPQVLDRRLSLIPASNTSSVTAKPAHLIACQRQCAGLG
jgi:hypothetical protein